MNTRKLQKRAFWIILMYISKSAHAKHVHTNCKNLAFWIIPLYISEWAEAKQAWMGKRYSDWHSICFNNECSCYNDWKYNFTSICLFSVSLYFLALIPILLYPGHSTVIVCIVKCSSLPLSIPPNKLSKSTQKCVTLSG